MSFSDDDHTVQADLGYQGEDPPAHPLPIKTCAGAGLTPNQRTVNALHSATRALTERGNALLENTFRALRCSH
ncbi:transposase family protein [Pseudonocardia sp. ICBG1142]|uniref:transposase family protein n=1 Tax=Pseudonocardia sp. ICBG1142 TaxID=2846760 RepID=UPI001CF6112B